MAAERMKLYTYWRSSAAYRVRIALNLKGFDYESIPVHLLENGGMQHQAPFADMNPQELVPVLVDGERVIRQSMAIIEYLDEAYEGRQLLLPVSLRERARVRALAQVIACDTHPLGNLRVLQYLDREFGVPKLERERWMQHWILLGLTAFEGLLVDSPSTGLFCAGDEPTLADVCLVPQVYNAQRWLVDLKPFPLIRRINDQCLKLNAFDLARPENQLDAPRL